MRILLIDNFDSFTYNLEHYLLQQGVEVATFRCDQIPFSQIEKNVYQGLVLSPGPGRPEDSGQLMEVFQLTHLPILGICLGMQAMGIATGCNLIHAPLPVHGKTSEVFHECLGVFRGLPSPTQTMRYHSLVLDTNTLDRQQWQVSAWTYDNLLMGIIHRDHRWEGVQFHPESIGTIQGLKMINNWIFSLRNPF
jgi:anthranilate synthase/aminodeoxychorismate synthase-like glutamine amidotransferase